MRSNHRACHVVHRYLVVIVRTIPVRGSRHTIPVKHLDNPTYIELRPITKESLQAKSLLQDPRKIKSSSRSRTKTLKWSVGRRRWELEGFTELNSIDTSIHKEEPCYTLTTSHCYSNPAIPATIHSRAWDRFFMVPRAICCISGVLPLLSAAFPISIVLSGFFIRSLSVIYPI